MIVFSCCTTSGSFIKLVFRIIYEGYLNYWLYFFLIYSDYFLLFDLFSALMVLLFIFRVAISRFFLISVFPFFNFFWDWFLRLFLLFFGEMSVATSECWARH